MAPRGGTVRPTSDRVREALFNILVHADLGGEALDGARVIDLFAGSGAVGLEALSRGAAHLTAVESDPAALAALRANAHALRLEREIAIVPGDATRPPLAVRPCAYAFLDPPYGHDLVGPALRGLTGAGWLREGSIAIVECARKERVTPPEAFERVDARAYGATRLVFLRYMAAPTDGSRTG